MDWFEGSLKVFYAIPLRVRAVVGMLCMVVLIWLPLVLGLLRAFSEHPAMPTVQQCYRDWLAAFKTFASYIARGDQGK